MTSANVNNTQQDAELTEEDFVMDITEPAEEATEPTPAVEANRDVHSAVRGTGNSFFGSCTEVGHVREHNEDSLVVMPPLFAVADGMGGHEAGEVASEIAINTIAELAPKHPDALALGRAVEAANLNVIKAPREGVGREGMGTTLTAAILEGERLLIAQVGDSRAYLMHQGRLQQLTRDHSLMADMIEAGQLTPEEARTHPNRSVITRAIGSDPHMQPDLYELNVETGDRLMLCSDGINTMLEDPQIEAIMARTHGAQECADALVAAALNAGGFDNATAVVVDVPGFKKARENKEKKKGRAFIAFLIVAVLAIFGLAGFGAYSYVNNSAYLIEENGTVSVYKGINDEFFGMKLSSLDHTTSVPVDKLQPGVANRIKEGISVSSIEEANELVAAYEEEIARQDSSKASGTATANTATQAQTQGAAQ